MRRFLLFALALLAGAYIIGIPLFLGQSDDPLPEDADAVVALAGSNRILSAAQTLVGGGIAPTLVVSADRNARDEKRVRLCKAKQPDVVCVYAGPFTSGNEAQAVTRLAERRNWDTLVLVTADYEMFRAERVFRRCGEFRVEASGVDEPWWRTAIGIPVEWVNLALAETVRRNC